MSSDGGRDQAVPNDLNLGIPELDDQHQAFFLHAVALRRALIDGGGRERLMKTLRYLETFVAEHFAAEERYMRLHNYPGILIHRKAHEVFARTVEELRKKARDLDSRGESISFLAVDIEHRLELWYTDHIRTMDRKMADFIVERS